MLFILERDSESKKRSPLKQKWIPLWPSDFFLHSWSQGLTYARKDRVRNLCFSILPSTLHAVLDCLPQRCCVWHRWSLMSLIFFKPLFSMSDPISSYFGNSSFFSIPKGKLFFNLLVKYYSFYFSHLFLSSQSYAYAKIIYPLYFFSHVNPLVRS